MKKIHFLKSKYSGFTLIETMVAISILSVAVVGVFVAVQTGIQDTSYAKDQITAFFMAQEGMEFIKNVRDENALKAIAGQPNTWLTGLSAIAPDPCYFGKTCRIDSPIGANNPGGIVNCPGGVGTCPNLNQNTVNGLYGYTSGANWVTTSFRREIRFFLISGSEALVEITITWNTRGVNHSFQVYESFFNR